MCQTHFMYLVCSFVCCNIDMSWNIEIIRRNFYSTTLEILNGNVTLVKDPVIYPDVNMTVLCHLEPVVKEKGYLRRTDEVFDTTLSGFFPLNFTYDVCVIIYYEW